jgi:hypothetical protein
VRSRLTAEALSRTPVDPAGTRWSVRIGWEPRWRHLAGRLAARRPGAGPAEPAADGVLPYARKDAVRAVVIVVGGTVLVVGVGTLVLIAMLLPVLPAGVVVLALALVVAGVVLVLRPWRVEAASPAGERFTAVVLGLPRAIRRRALVSYFLTRGLRPGH